MLVKIGVYVFARIFLVTFSLDQQLRLVVIIFAAASALVSAGAALRETDIKRIVAYSTVSQIAFIFLGLADGQRHRRGGCPALHPHARTCQGAGCSCRAGIVEQNAGTKDITKLGGLLKTMPVTAVSFLFCAFSVMGIPPLGGFFSKYMVISSAIGAGQIALGAVFMAGAVLTILYLFRLFSRVFLGEAQWRRGRRREIGADGGLRRHPGRSLPGGRPAGGLAACSSRNAAILQMPGVAQ